MQEVIERALFQAKKLGATYADVRLIEREEEDITVSNGKVEGVKKRLTKGFGVRVIVNGAWGFFSSYNVTPEEGERVATVAVEIAKASAMTKIEDARLAPIEIYQDKVHEPIKIDPFSIPLNKKIDFMLSLDKLMEMPGIVVRSSLMHFSKELKTFASLEGAFIEQERIVSGGGLQAIATDGREIQTRSYPASFGGDYARKGYEFIEEMKLEENAERIAKEALALLKAKPAPSGVMDLVIGPYQMALQLHESVGHPTELDRVLGEEASFAGTSFLTPEKLGNFQFGSKYVNIVADATLDYALGGFAYDDEGVKAKKIYLVKEGLFVGYLNSRETAFRLGLEPMGAMRADGWNRQPIIRMTSINLEPGNFTLEELIGGVDNGLLIDVNKSWSIDQKRLNFQFGTEIGYEIKNGKIQDMVKNPSYSGITYEFWRNLDGVGNESYYHVLGLPNCGKGEPMQVMEVSHGSSYARFRNVKVGVRHE
ncbi:MULTISPECIES: TldD/PmbA family protein [Caldisericum]|jgi:TldD protein|uniref:TldD/PmbA family protein n=1 Tax=Caldisericum TaxID=693074 RepID=UPI0039FBE5F2